MALLIDKDSAPGSSSLVDLFSVPTTQAVIDHSYWHIAHPVNTVTSCGPYQFTVCTGPDYLLLGKNYLYMQLKITKEDGNPLDATKNAVSVINLLGKTFFKQVKVGINGKLAYDSGPYAYRAFLETELNYTKDAKEDLLKAALYDKDSTARSATNKGFIKRAEPFKASAVVEMMAPIHCDLFLSDRLMLSNTQIQLELHRNSDKFALMCYEANPAYKIDVVDMRWFVKKMQLAPSIHLAIEASLMKDSAKYPIRRVAMTKLSVGPGRQSTPATSVFDGQISHRMVVGFVATDCFFGAYDKCPFVFSNNKVTEIYVQAGGHTYPREPFKTNFSANIFARAYLSLIDTLGLEHRSNDVSMTDFQTTHCLFAFDLTPDESDSECWELVREGTTTVHCTFAEGIKDPGVEMVVYAEFDNLAMIDRNRTVYFDYTI